MLIYLGSPYSSPDIAIQRERYQIALYAASVLAKAGVPCYCPIVSWHEVSVRFDLPGNFGFWLEQDKAMMDVCTAGWFIDIPGFAQSKGIMYEMQYLRSIKKPVVVTSLANLPSLAEGREY